jgi:hypothetical protein
VARTFQLIALFLGVWSIAGFSYTGSPSGAPRIPELKLRNIFDKETSTVHEKISVKLEFTNPSGDTLCFPDPDRMCSNSGSGSLITRAEPKSGEVEVFMCHVCGGGTWPREKLLREIEERWIKIAPNAV